MRTFTKNPLSALKRMRVEQRLAYFAGQYDIPIKGILHVGAHTAEELELYENALNVDRSNIVWVDAQQEKIDALCAEGIPNCYQAVLDAVERDAEFYITNATGSSSLYGFKKLPDYYPEIQITENRKVRTETLRGFFKRIKKNPADYNVWSFDIQGGEYPVLEASQDLLKGVDLLQTEVSTEELYEGTRLLADVDTLLAANNFTRVYTELTGCGWGDAIYVKSGICG
jgi:hypothetical protein